MIGFYLKSGKQQRSSRHAQSGTFEMAWLIHGHQFYREQGETARDQ
jgi:hypothetical protein